MSNRTLKIIKIVLGIYLVAIGIILFIDVYEQQPSDMPLKLFLASAFIFVGIAYAVNDIRKAYLKMKAEKAEMEMRLKEEEEQRRYWSLHDKEKFRTAPMKAMSSVKLEKLEENLEDFDERKIIVTDFEEENNKIKTPVKEKNDEPEWEEIDEREQLDDDAHDLAINIAVDDIVIDDEDVEELAINIEIKDDLEEEEV